MDNNKAKGKPDRLGAVAGQVRDYLVHIREAGFYGVDCSGQNLERIHSWGRSSAGPSETLSDIAGDLKTCRRCALSEFWPQAVPGAGNPEARLMFIGGFPEPEDKHSGIPFSGASGRLLNRMLKAMNFTRSSVYISHALKCAPHDGRSPETQLIMQCLPFLKREIAVVSPKIICVLGKAALTALFGESASLDEFRGGFHTYEGILVMPTFSPAYLLANPDAKRETWQDLKQVLGLLERQGAGRRQTRPADIKNIK